MAIMKTNRGSNQNIQIKLLSLHRINSERYEFKRHQEAFLTDCDAFCYVNPKADQAAVAELFDEAVDLYNSLKDKAAAREIEGSKKAYFTGLRKELVEKTDALYQKLSDLVKKTK